MARSYCIQVGTCACGWVDDATTSWHCRPADQASHASCAEDIADQILLHLCDFKASHASNKDLAIQTCQCQAGRLVAHRHQGGNM